MASFFFLNGPHWEVKIKINLKKTGKKSICEERLSQRIWSFSDGFALCVVKNQQLVLPPLSLPSKTPHILIQGLTWTVIPTFIYRSHVFSI